ncbi:MAG: OmpA family protein [Gemmatimonadetes bacterium]|nr:OmpA family protein [Gemmatimonadota bacterium]
MKTSVAAGLMAAGLAVCVAATVAAEEAASADSSASTLVVPLRPNALLYFRYGPPGGVRIRSGPNARRHRAPRADAPLEAREPLSPSLAPGATSAPPFLGQATGADTVIVASTSASASAPAPLAGALDVAAGAPPPLPLEITTGGPTSPPPVLVVPGAAGPSAGANPGTGLASGSTGGAAAGAGGLAPVPSVPSERVIREQILDAGMFRTNLILFETSRATLLPRSRDVIDTIGRVLAEFPATIVSIEGHADPRGAADFNQRLSERRAQAVSDYLVEHCAIDPGRLRVRGFGESVPIATGTSATELALNRRVEFRVLNPEALRTESTDGDVPEN